MREPFWLFSNRDDQTHSRVSRSVGQRRDRPPVSTAPAPTARTAISCRPASKSRTSRRPRPGRRSRTEVCRDRHQRNSRLRGVGGGPRSRSARSRPGPRAARRCADRGAMARGVRVDPSSPRRVDPAHQAHEDRPLRERRSDRAPDPGRLRLLRLPLRCDAQSIGSTNAGVMATSPIHARPPNPSVLPPFLSILSEAPRRDAQRPSGQVPPTAAFRFRVMTPRGSILSTTQRWSTICSCASSSVRRTLAR